MFESGERLGSSNSRAPPFSSSLVAARQYAPDYGRFRLADGAATRPAPSFAFQLRFCLSARISTLRPNRLPRARPRHRSLYSIQITLSTKGSSESSYSAPIQASPARFHFPDDERLTSGNNRIGRAGVQAARMSERLFVPGI